MNIDLKEQAHGEIERIFRILLSQNGLAVREEQIALCHAMLDTLLHNKIALCDAGVGIGKTYAYLTACILLKKFYPSGPAGSQPVVVSTSSVALQDAIIGEYIPFLSRIFLESHIIRKPIRAMVRKGKERFVCDARLAQRLDAVKGKNKNEEQRKALFSLRNNYDLDAVTGLSGFDRRQVCVPKVCEKTCPLRSSCRYHQYLKEARSAEIFVQICNHNYLLADAAHRIQELRPLLNDYRALVIDEAHKLPDAARQMYGRSLSAEDFHELCTLLEREKYILAAQNLREKFRALMSALCRGELLEEAQRTAFVLTAEREAALRDCLSLLRAAPKAAGAPPATVDPSPAGNNRTGAEPVLHRGPPLYPLHPIRQDRQPQPLRCQPADAGTAESCALAQQHSRHSYLWHPHGRGQLSPDPTAHGAVFKPASGRFHRRVSLQLPGKLYPLHSGGPAENANGQ